MKNLRWLAVLAAAMMAPVWGLAQGGAAKVGAAPELVILDTDIGDDIDDAFALGLVLESPELKLLGVTTAFGDTGLRARLTERYLAAAGRTDVPVRAGVETKASNVYSQRSYALHGSTTPVRTEGVAFLLETIRQHPGEITLIGIGPLTNVQAAIEKDAATFRKLKRVVIMSGRVYRGYDGEKGERRPADPEWNVVCDPAGLKALLGVGVPVFMMPLDSTQAHLEAKERERIFAHGSAVTDQITLLYHQWAAGTGNVTPTLFDPVAVAYAIRPALCPVKPMHLDVDEKGFTRPGEGKPNVEVCLESDEKGFLKLLEDRLTGNAVH